MNPGKLIMSLGIVISSWFVMSIAAFGQAGPWQRLSLPQQGDVKSITIDSAGNVYVVTSQGSFRSTDHGKNWTTAGDGLRYTVSPNGTIFRATGFAVDNSTDGGESWKEGGLITQGGTLVDASAMGSDRSGGLFIGTYNGEVYRSTDDGINWSKLTLPGEISTIRVFFFPTSSEVLVGRDHDILKSTNQGAFWNVATTNPSNQNAIHSFASTVNGLLLAGVEFGGLLKSSDRGQSWVPAFSSGSLASASVYGMTMTPRGYILAVTLEDGIYTSSDGENWSLSNDGIDDIYNFVSAAYSQVDGYAYIGGDNGKLYRVNMTTGGLPVVSDLHQDMFRIQGQSSNGRCRIKYYVPGNGFLHVSIYNAIGSLVLDPINEFYTNGDYSFDLPPNVLVRGTYIVIGRYNGTTISQIITID